MNEDLKVDVIGNYLDNKSIALCISGGIAAIETPKLGRHLRRYGADVQAYMTKESQKFIGKASLEWATEQAVVDELSGLAEHINKHDLVLVCPATLNTINKICAGIADNPVTTLVASALGTDTPVYIAPTMHDSLWHNPMLQRNLSQAEALGIHTIEPRASEGKRKIPKLDSIVAEVCKELSDDPIKSKRLLITGGPTPTKIDDVRQIQNIFLGTLAVEIAKDAYHRGADCTLLLGRTGIQVPSYISAVTHSDYDEYVENVLFFLDKGYDAGIFSAAVADYRPTTVYGGKVPSRGALKNIELEETEKVIEQVRKKYPDLFMATFKYERDIPQEDLFGIAESRLGQGYQIVVANRGEEISNTGHRAYIVTPEGSIQAESKKDIAGKLITEMGRMLP
jgi:phosphopantothenoylcysteine decarboxylase/phosphopantothenate--cysteine ligase